MLPAPLALLLRLIVLLVGVDFNQATSPATGGALPGVPPAGVQFAPVLKSELVVPFQSDSPSAPGFGLPPFPLPLLRVVAAPVGLEICARNPGVINKRRQAANCEMRIAKCELERA